MRRPDNITYTYTAGQYEDVDLERNDVIKARYTRVSGYEGNADVEALPKPPIDGRDVLNTGTVIPEALKPGNNDVDANVRIWALRSLRIPLINQKLVNDRLYYGLINSYANRTYSTTRHTVPIEINRERIELSIISDSYENSITTGSAIIGMPGTGKSTSIRIAVRAYPKAILHTFDGGHYIQIPIIRTTAYADSNISSLFTSFARTIDRILDTGDAHKKMLPKTNIGNMCEKIIEWIQRYHIGAWIIEEISFFAFSPAASRSFENITTIMEQTGIFLFATANNDFYEKLNGNLRQERRFLANFIDMDEVPREKDYMRSFIRKIWSNYMLPEFKDVYSEELFEVIYEWTMGSVDMLTILLVAIQRDYLNKKKKNKKAKPDEIVTTEFVKDVAEKNLSRMRTLFRKGHTKSVTEYTKIREEFDVQSKAEIKEEIEGKAALKAVIEEDLISGYDSQEKMYKVKESIKVFTDDYTDKKIESAFYYCEKNTEGFRKMKFKEMVRAVKARLEATGKKEISTKKKQQENIDAMYEELKGAMNDSGLQEPA